jgi:hypothetical protein
MNAVDRLWRALTAGDWASMAAQLGPNAVIVRLGDGPLDAEAYVAAQRAAGAPDRVEHRRTTGDGATVGLEATVVRDGRRVRVVGFYDLHDARIAGGTEAWAPDA